MALHVPKAPGVPQMLKEGARVSLPIHNQQFVHPLRALHMFLQIRITSLLFNIQA